MNQQYDYDYPPPPPQRSPAATATAPGSAASFPDRRPVQPPSTTTNTVARALAGSSQTPISATTFRPGGQHGLSPHSPAAPYSGVSPRTLLPPPSQVSSPNTSMEPYNPQQWSNRGQVSGTQMVFQQRNVGPPSTRDVTGMEGV